MLFVLLVLAVAGGLDGGCCVRAEPGSGAVTARRLAEPPVIDGVVSPEEWAQAERISPFWFLEAQREADLPTVAYVGYTSDGIYAGFVCEDPEPEKIMAQEIRRGADLSKDDHAELAVEPTGLDIEPYAFRVSARGSQAETIPGGSVSIIRWRGEWKAAVSRHNSGWSAEMFIPFRILRIPRGQREFGIILSRHVPRLGVTYRYPNMGRVYDPLRRARWQGVQAPEVLPPPVILPYLQLDSGSNQTDWRGGLDVKLTSSGGLTTLLTLNPDFKNIARDVDTVAFSYVPRIVRETRPFFVEGDGFFPDTTLFYSGNITAVDAALKSFGTLGRWSYGALVGTGGDQRVGVARLGYQITDRSRTEVQFIWDERPGVRATALGTGVVAHPSTARGYDTIGVLYFRTDSNNMPVGEKTALSFWRAQGDGQISFGGQVFQMTRAFQPSLGYAPEVGLRGWESTAVFSNRWTDRALQEINMGATVQQRWRLDGGTLDEGIGLWVSSIYRNDTALWLYGNLYHRPPYRDHTIDLGASWNYRRLYNSGGIMLSLGKVAGGDSLFYRISQGIPFTQRLRLKLDYERSHIRYAGPVTPDYRLHQLIATLNYDIDAERSIGGRYIGRGSRFGGFNNISTLYLTFRQQVRRGADIFLIFGDPNASSTQTRFAVKVITPW